MDRLLYYLGLSVVKALQALPLRWVARLGRLGGGLTYWVDARHRRTALQNLTMCFGAEKSAEEIRALARENFKRIGESFGCSVKTAGMSWEELAPHIEFVGMERLQAQPSGEKPQSRVMAIGHFGNFELYARLAQMMPEYKCATTYRSLHPPALNRLLLTLRERSGCLFIERRGGGPQLRSIMSERGVLIGLLADQAAGAGGLWGPFLGHPCSTITAPAVYALRYQALLLTGFCYRVGLGRWRIEAGADIPTHENGQPRSSQDITRDINRAFEAAVLRDPANWFWVHNRWKAVR